MQANVPGLRRQCNVRAAARRPLSLHVNTKHTKRSTAPKKVAATSDPAHRIHEIQFFGALLHSQRQKKWAGPEEPAHMIGTARTIRTTISRKAFRDTSAAARSRAA